MTKRTRKTPVRTTGKSVPKKRRTAVRRTSRSNGNLTSFFVPVFFILCILVCLGFLAFMGYRTVTASEFFEVRKIEVRGANRASKENIESIVKNHSEKSGVWNADLTAIKEKVESLSFVKSVSVSRVLPDGVRVNVVERVPKAVVRIEGGDFWADDEGVILALVGKSEERLPPMSGWDQRKSDDALKMNQQRVKIYQKMVEEWREFDLIKRVKSVNLKDINKPRVMAEDSGAEVFIEIGKDDFKKNLQRGLEGIANKGAIFMGIEADGTRLRPIPRVNANSEN